MKQILCFFMTMLILFADAGQTIYAHTCLKSNNVSFSINTPAACKEEQQHVKKACCEKEKQKQENDDCTVGKKDCCTVSGKYIKASLGADSVKAVHINMPVQTVFIVLFQLFSFEAGTQISAFYYPTPPPLAYSNSQSFIQVFRC